jgi:hypothetical protein
MARKMNHKEALAEVDRLNNASTLYMLAMNDLAAGEVTWRHWFKSPDYGSYRIGFSRLDSPNGGIVLMSYRQDAQSSPYTTVYYLDAIEQSYRDACTPEQAMIRAEIASVVSARYAIYEKPRQAA